MRQGRTGSNRRGSRFPLSSIRRRNDLPLPRSHGSKIKVWGKTHVVIGSNRASRKRSSETRALGNRKSETLPFGSMVKYTSTLPIRFDCFCRSRSYTACRWGKKDCTHCSRTSSERVAAVLPAPDTIMPRFLPATTLPTATVVSRLASVVALPDSSSSCVDTTSDSADCCSASPPQLLSVRHTQSIILACACWCCPPLAS